MHSVHCTSTHVNSWHQWTHVTLVDPRFHHALTTLVEVAFRFSWFASPITAWTIGENSRIIRSFLALIVCTTFSRISTVRTYTRDSSSTERTQATIGCMEVTLRLTRVVSLAVCKDYRPHATTWNWLVVVGLALIVSTSISVWAAEWALASDSAATDSTIVSSGRGELIAKIARGARLLWQCEMWCFAKESFCDKTPAGCGYTALLW